VRQYREARAVLHTAMSDRRVPRVCPACSRVFPRVPACSGVGSVAGPSAHELRPPSNHRGHLLGVFIIGAPERPVSRL